MVPRNRSFIGVVVTSTYNERSARGVMERAARCRRELQLQLEVEGVQLFYATRYSKTAV